MTRIRKLSTPPTRQDPATFASRGDNFLSDLLGWGADANALADELNALKLANDASILSTLAQATAARDAALAAWGASMAPAEVLPAISQQLHYGAAVKAIFYDTSKDSDGGAWRKRCQDKPWYNETIYGNWLGQVANEAAARAATGATTNSYFQSTSDGKFYALNAGAGVTEVFRGNAREFPAQAAIVAETGRVTIYDLTQLGCPMWMVFATTFSAVQCVSALNGVIVVGRSAAPMYAVSFVKDSMRRWYNTSFFTGEISNSIKDRNSTIVGGTGDTNVIVNATVNDVAMTVLPDAPIDVATGLPIPTIAVALPSSRTMVLSLPNNLVVVKRFKESCFSLITPLPVRAVGAMLSGPI